MRQRVLVLGAGGFIGRRVVAALAVSSWAIPVAAGHRSPLAAGMTEVMTLDAADERSLARAMAGADAVVNCIAGSAATIVATARALFAVAGRAPSPPRIVHLSSMAVYGSATGTLDESAPLRGDTGDYAAAKVEAEAAAARCATVVTLRPGCVYGAGSVQWSQRIARWLAARRIGDLGAAGDGACNLVHVADVVTAVGASLRLPDVTGQAFNLGSPRPPSWNEYFVRFARALGAVPVRRISRRQLALETRVFAPPLKIAEIAARLAGLRALRLPAPISPALLRSFGQDLTLDVSKAQERLGVRWTPYDTGLRDTALQLRAQGLA